MQRTDTPAPLPLLSPGTQAALARVGAWVRARRGPLGEGLAWLLLAAAVVALFGPSLHKWCGWGGDYRAHADFAVAMFETQSRLTPHFFYHLLLMGAFFVVVLFRVFTAPPEDIQYYGGYPWSMPDAALLVMLAALLLQAGVLYRHFRPLWDTGPRWRAMLVGIALALALSVIGALQYLLPLDGKHYFGFITPTVFHNPTVTLLKPLALLLFLGVVRLWQTEARLPWRLVGGLAALTVLSTLAKPSYAICLFPVLGLAWLGLLCRRQYPRVLGLTLGVLAPMVLLLGWQYLVTYSSGQGDGTYLLWAPLHVMRYGSDALLPKFLLSIAFPLVVYLAYFPLARREVSLNLAWAVFGVSAGYLYLLAESGKRMFDGNMGWGAQVAVFILFVATTHFLARQAWRGWRALLGWAFFLLHLVNGLIWWWWSYRMVTFNI